MDYPRFCGCKGRRSCLQCESKLGIEEIGLYDQFKHKTAYVYCPHCSALYPGWDVDAVLQQHPDHDNQHNRRPFPGVLIEPDFISAAEETDLLHGIDSMPWQTSQSGRRKQNFGPKTNFKKMKLAAGDFDGFPAFSQFVQRRFEASALLETFHTIEQCSLEYDPAKGAAIDPHIDDCWIWGERVVTVNLLSDSVLTLTLYAGDPGRYNLPQVDRYRGALLMGFDSAEDLRWAADACVRLPMPRRSLMVLYGGPRYQWEHCVLREDIAERRVCLAYREFTVPYLPDGGPRGAGKEEDDVKLDAERQKGAAVLALARKFFDHQHETMVSEV